MSRSLTDFGKHVRISGYNTKSAQVSRHRSPMSRSQQHRRRPPAAVMHPSPVQLSRCSAVRSTEIPASAGAKARVNSTAGRCESIASGTKRTVPAFQQSSGMTKARVNSTAGRCESIASGTKRTVPAFQQSSAGSTDRPRQGLDKLDQRCRPRVSAKGRENRASYPRVTNRQLTGTERSH